MKRPDLRPVRRLSLFGGAFALAVVAALTSNPTPAVSETASPPTADRRVLERARTHWAFQPIARPAPPPDPPGSKPPGNPHPIDRFVRATLHEQGLTPNPPAPPREQIRRLYFDLIGLPPSPDAVDAFVQDPSDAHYARIVDDLLALPQFGERWARHWLDLARYTESTGFEYDRIREHAWHYRDYVIRSFAADKPYDRFMQEQIAGDVLEPVTRDGILGASLLVCGAYDQAGNSQANLTQRTITREEELEDLISVVGQTFLGLTLNCARCHEHKFDPIPLTDYYRIKSVFDGVLHGERPLETPDEARQREEKAAALRATLAAAESRAGHLRTEGWKIAVSKSPARPEIVGPLPWLRWSFEDPPAEAARGTPMGGAFVKDRQLHLPTPGAFFESPPLSRDLREKTLEVWVSLSDLAQRGGAALSVESADGQKFDAITFGEREPGKWTAGSDGFLRTRDLEGPRETSLPGEWIHLAIVYRADASIAVFRNGAPYGKPYTPEKPLATFEAGDARVVLGRRHRSGGMPWLTGSILRAAVYDRALSPDEVLASFRAAGFAVPEAQILAALPPGQKAEHEAALEEARAAREALANLSRPPTVAYAGKRTQPPPTQRFRRGDVRSPDGVVTPGALTALADVLGDFDLPADAPEAERRLRFARWLAHPRNPLPARVIANRLWYHHFGQGIVATPSDFGAGGARPTHPELLDWLATSLLDGGWKLKALHRLVVTSATYRQSSDFKPEAARIDADNQFLWRFQPRRLDAETLRDTLLAVGGRLDPRVGGPSFRPFTTTEFNATFYHPFDKDEPDYNRRTVYRMNVNSGKDPMLDVFDCPDPSIKTPRRATTTTPLQALGLMNGSFTQRQARALADRASSTPGDDLPTRVGRAYRLALGRLPTAAELERAVDAARERDLASVCWVLLNSTEFLYVR